MIACILFLKKRYYLSDMEAEFWTALAASSAAAAVTTRGIIVIRRFESWGRRNSTYFVSFAAGVLITVSFLHIVPKSFSMAGKAPVFFVERVHRPVPVQPLCARVRPR